MRSIKRRLHVFNKVFAIVVLTASEVILNFQAAFQSIEQRLEFLKLSIFVFCIRVLNRWLIVVKFQTAIFDFRCLIFVFCFSILDWVLSLNVFFSAKSVKVKSILIFFLSDSWVKSSSSSLSKDQSFWWNSFFRSTSW